VKHNAVYLLVALIAASCARPLQYMTDFPLSGSSFVSRDGSFSGGIPRGWFSSSDDTLAPSLVAWLIREDFSATITVREIKLDRLTVQRVGKEGMKLLAQISAGLQDESPPGSALEPNEFELRGNKFCGYEFNSAKGRKRVVVFSAKGKYYESEAYSVKGTPPQEEFSRLFTAQQTVLSSLNF